MSNIRDKKENGGIILSEEEKKRLEEIAKRNPQKFQIQADYFAKIQNEKKDSKEEKEKETKTVVKKYLMNDKNSHQQKIDEMIQEQIRKKKQKER